MPPSTSLSKEAVGPERNKFVSLEDTSVESLLQISTQALAHLQVPRDQLSDVLEHIYNGTCGFIYRTQMYTGDPVKSKSVILKALKGKEEVLGFPLPIPGSGC